MRFRIDFSFSLPFPPKYCFFRSVTDPRDGKRVALKKMPNVFQNLVSCKRVFRELKMLCFFKHDNVSEIGVWGKLFTRPASVTQLRTTVSLEGIEFSCSFMPNSEEQKAQCGTLKYLFAGPFHTILLKGSQEILNYVFIASLSFYRFSLCLLGILYFHYWDQHFTASRCVRIT